MANTQLIRELILCQATSLTADSYSVSEALVLGSQSAIIRTFDRTRRENPAVQNGVEFRRTVLV